MKGKAPQGSSFGEFFSEPKTQPTRLPRVPEVGLRALAPCWAGSERGTHVWPGHRHGSRELHRSCMCRAGSAGHTRVLAPSLSPPPEGSPVGGWEEARGKGGRVVWGEGRAGPQPSRVAEQDAPSLRLAGPWGIIPPECQAGAPPAAPPT